MRSPTHKKLEAVTGTQAAVAAFVGFLLTWKPALVVTFPSFFPVYTKDLSKVFIVEGCLEYSNATVAIFCLIEVLLAAYLFQLYFVPWCFGAQKW